MRSRSIVALVFGCLLLLPGAASLVAGAGLGVGYGLGRDSSGYLRADAVSLHSPTVAVTAGPMDVLLDAGTPQWLMDRSATQLRLDVARGDGSALFVGIGTTADVEAYLAGVARDQVIAVTNTTPEYHRIAGAAAAAAPRDQTFWVASASGPGPLRLDWSATGGRWSVVLMNADATAGVVGEVTASARSEAVLPAVLVLLGFGGILTAGALALIVVGAKGRRSGTSPTAQGSKGLAGPADAVSSTVTGPVLLNARLDPGLSRWKWLVKWVLVLPHLFVLAFLWTAFVLLTVVAAVAIMVTGAYPRAIFEFNLGVLRWSWRVAFYATTGGIGTDRYPPFSLGLEPDYPATLWVRYPAGLSRALVPVKWLLALPHLLIISLLLGSTRWVGTDADPSQWGTASGAGLLGLLVLVAGVVLLFSGRYPRALFDLIIGLNRWVYRVVVYVALMSDQYPPFRLDQGGPEPAPTDPLPTPDPSGAADLREPDLHRVN